MIPILNRLRISFNPPDLAQIQASLAADALLSVQDGLALTKQRIHQKGENLEGEQFEEYTPGYKRNRQRDGYQIDIVDFFRTGRLSANIQPVVFTVSNGKVTIRVTASQRENQLKLQGALKKRDNILAPSQSEIGLIERANALRRQRRYNR